MIFLTNIHSIFKMNGFIRILIRIEFLFDMGWTCVWVAPLWWWMLPGDITVVVIIIVVIVVVILARIKMMSWGLWRLHGCWGTMAMVILMIGCRVLCCKSRWSQNAGFCCNQLPWVLEYIGFLWVCIVVNVVTMNVSVVWPMVNNGAFQGEI